MMKNPLKEPIFYVTPDPVRAIGLEKVLPNYHIVCLDDSQLVDQLLLRGVRVFSLGKMEKKARVLRNTGEILAQPLVQEYIAKQAQGERPNILFFKPSPKIELICHKLGYCLLGNSVDLNQKFEDKNSFYRFCQEWGLPVAPGEIQVLKSCLFEDLASRYGKKLVVQFGHGWAGKTTFFVNEKSDFENLKLRFSEREVRITRFINGETFLNNACVTWEEIFISPPAIQITATEGLTANPGGTCGRQWPAKMEKKIEEKMKNYTQIIGEKMREAGYKGYFGLDFLLEEKTGNLYLSENNARLTASVPLYTKMELKVGQTPLLFYHLLEFVGENYSLEETKTGKKEPRGAELILRNNQSSSVKVTRDFAPGIYTFEKQKLTFVRKGESIEEIENENEFFALASNLGRMITSENELARIDSLREILDDRGKVCAWAKEALLEIKRKLELETNAEN